MGGSKPRWLINEINPQKQNAKMQVLEKQASPPRMPFSQINHDLNKPVMPERQVLPLLKGQKALVTGASAGIGKAIALALGHAGAEVCDDCCRRRRFRRREDDRKHRRFSPRGEALGRYADKVLRARGVDIYCKTKVTAVTPSEVELSNGERTKSFTLIWTAGTSPNPTLDLVTCPKERGRVRAKEYFEGCPGIWALEHCALVPDSMTGQFCPRTAQHASRQGKVLAQNIAASVRGGAKKPFRFKTLGLLAAIGHRTGVARILGVNFSDFIAWRLWHGIYWSRLPRVEKKLRVAIDWVLHVFFPKDFVQYLHQSAPTISRSENQPPPPSNATATHQQP